MTLLEEEQRNLAEYEAEAMWVTKEYGDLLQHYQEVERANRAFQRECRVIEKEYEEENYGDA